MASLPSDPGPILGRVDAHGRLIAADRELEALQVEAGSRIGATVAIPQLAEVSRIVTRLRIPVSRRVLAAGKDRNIDMWVRAVPEGDGVALAIDRWSARPATGPRLTSIGAVEHERLEPEPFGWSVDEHLLVASMAPGLAELATDTANAKGMALTRVFRLEESEDGAMPLLDALASRTSFSGQLVTVRGSGSRLILDGEAVIGPSGDFGGFEGTARLI
ncbi:MAG TPA: PAS domain-containing sensor histidine kinase, partial [Sphingomicrobium sp.]|nr:PAS domain-containing sensor histidine kinase [Sphingomicrobium sp.]